MLATCKQAESAVIVRWADRSVPAGPAPGHEAILQCEGVHGQKVVVIKVVEGEALSPCLLQADEVKSGMVTNTSIHI